MEKKSFDKNKSLTDISLMADLRSDDKDNIFCSDVSVASFLTGFPVLDYNLGYVIAVRGNDGTISNYKIAKGIVAGSYNLFCGRSGVGKSSWVIQISANIIRPYRNGGIYHFDVEQATTPTRIQQLAKLDISDFDPNNENARYILKQGACDSSVIQKTIAKFYKKKTSYPEKYQFKTNQIDEFGRSIVSYEPTIIIIDSIPMLASVLDVDNVKDAKKMDDIDSNTAGAAYAKQFKSVMRKSLPLMKEANIIILGVTHINKKIEINPMIHTEKDMRGLGQDEVLMGGDAVKYGATNIIKLSAKSGKYLIDEGDGFNGFDSYVTIVKSRTTQDGRGFSMIYDQNTGMDTLRSTIVWAKQNGIVDGNRNKMRFVDEPSTTFSMINIYKDFNEKPEFKECMKKFIYPKLENIPVKPSIDVMEYNSLLLDY